MAGAGEQVALVVVAPPAGQDQVSTASMPQRIRGMKWSASGVLPSGS